MVIVPTEKRGSIYTLLWISAIVTGLLKAKPDSENKLRVILSG